MKTFPVNVQPINSRYLTWTTTLTRDFEHFPGRKHSWVCKGGMKQRRLPKNPQKFNVNTAERWTTAKMADLHFVLRVRPLKCLRYSRVGEPTHAVTFDTFASGCCCCCFLFSLDLGTCKTSPSTASSLTTVRSSRPKQISPWRSASFGLSLTPPREECVTTE